MSKKVFVKTFGCQMNVYDSDRITDTLKTIGYEKSENLKIVYTSRFWISQKSDYFDDFPINCLFY